MQQIFSAYRAADYHNLDAFVAQAMAVLADYSDVTVRFISDYRTGIQRRQTFAPTIAEIITACEEHERYLDRTGPATRRLPRPDRRFEEKLEYAPGSLAQMHVPHFNEHYAAMCERAKREDEKFWEYAPSSDGVLGIRVPITWWPGSIGTRDLHKPRATPAEFTWEASDALKDMLRGNDEQGGTEA